MLSHKENEKRMKTEQRIAHLETRCNRLTLALTGMMALAVALVCVAAKPNPGKDSLQARTLEIVDNDGNVRIRLGPADEGYGLVVKDAEGQTQATLTDAPLGAAISLRKHGGGTIGMMAMPNGCGITIRDPNGKARAYMMQQVKDPRFKQEGKLGPQIVLRDAEGKTVFSAPQ